MIVAGLAIGAGRDVEAVASTIADEDVLASPHAASSGPVSHVCVSFVDRASLCDDCLHILAEELAAVWRFNGVEIDYSERGAGTCTWRASRAVLFWIARSPVQLLPGMRTSLTSIGGTVTIGGVPTDIGYVLADRLRTLSPADELRVPRVQARLLGRVAAHELGHMLLRTVRHADHGLMRARFGFADVRRSAACEAFSLTPAERAQIMRELQSGQGRRRGQS